MMASLPPRLLRSMAAHGRLGLLSKRCFSPPVETLRKDRDFYRQIITTVQGRVAEVRQYLKHFAQIDSQKFAVLLIEETLNPDALEDLGSSLTFIHKCGLHPIVIHGNSRWRSKPFSPFEKFKDEPGYNLQSLFAENARITDAIELAGGRAKPLVGPVFQVKDPLEQPNKGRGPQSFENLLRGISTEEISSVIRLGHLPVIAPVGVTPKGEMLHLSPLLSALSLARTVQPHKAIFINSKGGLMKGGKIMNNINLMDEFPALAMSDDITPETKDKLSLMISLLKALPVTSSVATTSCRGLVDELFTHIGSNEGTLLRLGMKITIHDNLKTLDIKRLTDLLEHSFGKTLHHDYFERLKTIPFKVYLSGNYKGCAILTYEGGVPYLCKFAVQPQSQGQGIADLLWAYITKENSDLFWRSREDNGVNNWYFSRADGSYRAGKWTVFWYGLKGFDMMKFFADYSTSLPPTFHQKIESTFS